MFAEYDYAFRENGWCKGDYKWLSGYNTFPPRLSVGDALYSSDPVQECMFRCLADAVDAAVDAPTAFYVRRTLATVRAHPGRLSGISVLHDKSILY